MVLRFTKRGSDAWSNCNISYAFLQSLSSIPMMYGTGVVLYNICYYKY